MQDVKTVRHLTDAEIANAKEVGERYHQWRCQVDAEIRQRIHHMMNQIGSSLFESQPLDEELLS